MRHSSQILKRWCVTLLIPLALTLESCGQKAESESAFESRVKSAFQSKDYKTIRALYNWEGVHYITDDQISFGIQNMLDNCSGESWVVDSVTWDKEFVKKNELVRTINGRKYSPNLPAEAIMYIVYKDMSTTGHSTNMTSAIVGRDSAGKLWFAPDKVEEIKPKPAKQK